MPAKKIILIITAMLLLTFSGSAFAVSGSTSVPAICQNMDAQKMVEKALQLTSLQTNNASGTMTSDTGASAIYGDNKWLVSCAVAYGIQNIDGAVNALKGVDATKIFSVKTTPVQVTGSGRFESQSGLVSGPVQAKEATEALNAMISSLEDLSKSDIFGKSIFSRTYTIGLYLICFTFLISLGVKLYGMFIGKSQSEPIDLIFYFIRLVTLIGLMTFMRPLVFWGMGLSTDIANMLLRTPITSAITSGVLYTSGKYGAVEGQSAYSPWLQSSAEVSSAYGAQDYNRSYAGGHRGIDYKVPTGTPIYAPYDGRITANNDTDPGGFGLWVALTPASSVKTDPYKITHRAGHLNDVVNKLKTSRGYTSADFKQGELVGHTGNSGTPVGGGSYGAHLHADVRIGGGFFSQGDHVNPAMVYDFHDGNIEDLSGIYKNTSSSSSTPSSPSGTNIQSTGQGSYTVTGQDSLSMNMLFNEMLDLKWDMTKLGDEKLSLMEAITSGFAHFLGGVLLGNLARWFANVVLMVLIVLADVLMALTIALGPLVIALSLIPQFENFLQNWIKGYITFLFYQPLASCFQLLSIVMLVVTLDSGVTPFLLLCACYVGACMKIPNIADGLSTSAVIGTASMLAFAPVLLARNSAASMVGMAGQAGMTAAPAVVSGAKNLISKFGGGSGKISTKLAVLIAIIGILISTAAGASTMTSDQKKEILEVGREQEYPPSELLAVIEDNIRKKTSLTNAIVYNGNSVSSSVPIVSKNNPTSGIYNTSYTNAVDTPMAKYVLGSGKLQIDNAYKVMALWNGNANGATTDRGKQIQLVMEEAQKSITDLLMRDVPLYILFLMFLLQLACIGYLKFTNEEGIGQRISYLSAVPRLVLYMLLILVFPHLVSAAITISNYISNAIVPLESQQLLMTNISSKPTALNPSSVIANHVDGFVVWICRALTYLAIKIILIARDMFLTISIIVGPTCIALGYFTRFRDPDYVHQFYTGWLESFIKILFWGPLAAIMLFCLGSLSVLTSMDMLSTFSIAVTGIAFVYAAGNLPNMAEKMSSVAVMGLLTAMSPFLLSGAKLGLRSGVLGFGMFGGLGVNYMLSKGWSGGLLNGLGTMFGVMRNLGAGPNARSHWKNQTGGNGSGGGGTGGGGGSSGGGGGNGNPDRRRRTSGGNERTGNGNNGNGGNGNPERTHRATGSNPLPDPSKTFVDQKSKGDLRSILGALIGTGLGGNTASGAQGVMKSSINGETIALSTDANTLLAASSSILHTLNKNGDMESIREALANGNMTRALFGSDGNSGLLGSDGFDEKIGIGEGSQIVRSAAVGLSVVAMAANWSQKLGEKYGDSGFDKKEIDAHLLQAQEGINAALTAYNDGKISQEDAAAQIGEQVMAVSSTLDFGVGAVSKNEGSVSVPQAPSFGASYHSQGLISNIIGINEAKDNAYQKLQETEMGSFAADFTANSFRQAVMGVDGSGGLINNETFLRSSGLSGENSSVVALTVGMTSLNFARDYAAAAREDQRIDANTYNSAIRQITDIEHSMSNLMSDYYAGNLNLSPTQVTEAVDTMMGQVSVTLDAFAPASSKNNNVIDNFARRIEATSFAADFSAHSFQYAVMGQNGSGGLINNEKFLQSTGLNGENSSVVSLTVGMTGLTFASDYAAAALEDKRIDEVTYNSAMRQIASVENNISAMMTDYYSGNLNISPTQVTEAVDTMMGQVSVTLDAFAPAPVSRRDDGVDRAAQQQRIDRITGIVESMMQPSQLEQYIDQLRKCAEDKGLGEKPHIRSSGSDYLS